jgi:hypothetical protein
MPTSQTAQSEATAPSKKEVPKLRFPPWYDPDSPVVKERRRKLFEALAAGYSPEAEEAMERIAQDSRDDEDDLE